MSHKRSFAAFQSDSNTPPQHAPYALYGTPLPAYDPEARDDGSYVPIWKQEVTDERGRKRLHGAFTGGFSAGYFNTVGSKEGWTPATFVSSRANRAKQEQKVEDFMDEEDLAEREEAQRLETNDAFAGLGSAGAGGEEGKGGMFADLFRTTGETMGVKLLQRMGWRQGQGVGPKVKRRAKGDDGKGEAHLFAPENSRMISFDRKTDRKGVGFAGEERLESGCTGNDSDNDGEGEHDARILQTGRSKVLEASKANKKGLKKGGGSFGLGVLNDTGSDDEDEYDMGPKMSYSRVIGGNKPKKKGGLVASTSTVKKPPIFASSSSKKLAQRTTTTLSGFRKCHDGRLPLDGFILTATPLATLQQENKYPPPAVPEGWKPASANTANDNSSSTFQSTADAAKTSTLSPKSRAALLREQQLPSKSVFDFLTPSARSRVAAASGKGDLPPALGERAPVGFEAPSADEQRRTLWDLVPKLDQATAEAALARGKGGFMPYSEDEEKRNRYIYFLSLHTGVESNLPPRPKNTGTEEWAKELREFKQAAEVFRPMAGLLGSRFTSSTGAPRLASDAPDTQPLAKGEKVDDPAEKAAKMGMYGPLTRSRQPFYPTRLLCKRFNVRPPASVAVDPGSAPNTNPGDAGASNQTQDVVSQASLDRMMREASFSNKPSGGSGFVSGGVEGGSEDSAVTGRPRPAQVEVERNEALEGQRAGEAVFKAIFGSDDEDNRVASRVEW